MKRADAHSAVGAARWHEGGSEESWYLLTSSRILALYRPFLVNLALSSVKELQILSLDAVSNVLSFMFCPLAPQTKFSAWL